MDSGKKGSRGSSNSTTHSLQTNPLLAAAAVVAAAEAAAQGGENHESVMPSNMIRNGGADIDFLLQVHRRKMLRRAANRRSAQLSRARKKVKVIPSPTTLSVRFVTYSPSQL